MTADGHETTYAFLLLLSQFGKDAGNDETNAAKVFEEICAVGSQNYFGGKAWAFGFPRTHGPGGFRDAVELLCDRMGEGGGASTDTPGISSQNDAKLDVVSWVDFPDLRPGKLIAFGQCATSKNWEAKLTELPVPEAWFALWLQERPFVPVQRLFFVPHRVESDKWKKANLFGGILFDRCRIAHTAQQLDDEIAGSRDAWTKHVVRGALA